MLELLFSEKVLGVLLNIVGLTCLLVWTTAFSSQLALRLHEQQELPVYAGTFGYGTPLDRDEDYTGCDK